ncbi:MAG: hypothetical protein LAP38_16505 [Acidobacteriia bacterium]|nr:hypothetical protein [Terriglobia bacterium]
MCLAVSAAAQPVIRGSSVVNAANNLPAGLPNAGLAQGSTFVLKGRNLGAKGTVVASSFPLGATMGGTSMKITVGGTTVNVLMVYVVGGLSDDQGPFDQLAGIVPSNTPTGSGTLTVTYNNQTSASVPVTILANAFGIFTINQQGSGPGVFTDPNYKVNTLINSAHSGEQWFIWGSGLGAISSSDANTPPVGNLNVAAQVYVGGVQAKIGYQGRSGCCSGIDQILITIPAGVTGCYVPVVVTAAGVVSNFATISIAQSGSICSDPTGYSVADLQKAQSNTAMTVADLGVFRISADLSTAGGVLQGVSDQGSAYFRKYNGASGVLASLPVLLPSTGCIVYYRPSAGTALLDNFTLSPQHDYIGLDGGASLNLSGPQGAQILSRKDTGGPGAPDFRYKADLGGDPPLDTAGPAYLLPGSYTLSGSGGADVGGFSAKLSVPSVSNPWTNEDAVVNLPRNQDLTITLNPSGTDIALGILGNSVNTSIGQIGIINCAIPPGATSFTIPSYVLSALPASGLSSDLGGVPIAFLGVAVGLANPTKVQVPGADAGAFTWFDLFIKNVNFQ